MSDPPGLGSGAAAGEWLRDARIRQVDCLPDGPTVVSSVAPYGQGGLGRHLAEMVDALAAKGSLAGYLSPGPRSREEPEAALDVSMPPFTRVAQRMPPLRWSRGLSVLAVNRIYDVAAARRLPSGPEHLLVFSGHGLRHMRAARRLGYRSVMSLSAISHMANVARQHRLATRTYPIERPWGPSLLRVNLAEYRRADRVCVSSRYSWQTFIEEGFPEDRLAFFPLTPDDRYQQAVRDRCASTFDVVYVGSLSVVKGVPLLIEAFRRLRHHDLRLVLVGGAGSRGMRRYVEAACAADPRIVAGPGDPLPHLVRAGVYVHPSYEDGFGYAPAEALAVGLPVIASQDTGMAELLSGLPRGLTVPTGDRDYLTGAIEAAYSGAWPVEPAAELAHSRAGANHTGA